MRGSGLPFLGPTGFGRVPGDLATATVRQRFQPSLAPDAAALASHLGHDLRDEIRAGRGCFRFGAADEGFEDHAAGVLNNIELRLSNPLRHSPRSHGHGRFVKLEGFSN